MNFSESINGLQVAMDQINTISNNIANSTTNGFKSNRTSVENIMTRSNNESNEKKGLGTTLSRTIQNYSKGETKITGKKLDLCINQDGFFRLQDINGLIYYTRNGEFHIDQKNNVVNVNGMYLTGYLKIDDKFQKKPEIINLNKFKKMPAKQTTEVILTSTINSKEPSLNNVFKKNQPSTYNYKTSVVVFDEKHQTHILGVYWKKNNSRVCSVYLCDETAGNHELKHYEIEYSTHGHAIANNNITGMISAYKEAKESSFSIQFNKCTQSNQKTEFNIPIQDGYRSGELYSYTILENGDILGKYTNQKNDVVGKIAIKKFDNLDILTNCQDNLLKIKDNINQNHESITDENNLNSLTIGALEKSNVNINNELINLITAQKNYQSIIQSIKIQNELDGVLLNDLR